MGNIIRPGSSAVCLAREGATLGRGVRCPGSSQARRSERSEITALAADGLDDHEVLGGLLASQGIHLHGFEEVVGAVGHDRLVGGAERPGELVDGHGGAVDLAVVAAEEEVHSRVITDNRLVDHAGGGTRDAPREEGLHVRPAICVGRIVRSTVREGRGAPLVGKNPDVLGREVEERGRDGGVVHLVLGSIGELGEVAD